MLVVTILILFIVSVQRPHTSRSRIIASDSPPWALPQLIAGISYLCGNFEHPSPKCSNRSHRHDLRLWLPFVLSIGMSETSSLTTSLATVIGIGAIFHDHTNHQQLLASTGSLVYLCVCSAGLGLIGSWEAQHAVLRPSLTLRESCWLHRGVVPFR
ncbi:hypothetical protein RRG08_056868 [Elysia crispata]|uniref:Uncharacterized protein n=1 Tax=Elysia crispata TaxID=231223 RepID=A0AAE1DEC0_9GAST|nr:hypothetical protein RRG08_056868 [Elysia crispata]